LKRYGHALASYDRSLALDPDNADALNNRGSALHELEQFDEALASYNRALAIRPNHAEACFNAGNALQELKRYEEALVSYDRALAITSDYADEFHSGGNALQKLKAPDQAFLFGLRLFCKMLICDWREFAYEYDRLAAKIGIRTTSINAISVLATPLSAELQRACAETFVKEKHPQTLALPPPEAAYRHDRIRLGYFSSDFYNHPVAALSVELFRAA